MFPSVLFYGSDHVHLGPKLTLPFYFFALSPPIAPQIFTLGKEKDLTETP